MILIYFFQYDELGPKFDGEFRKPCNIPYDRHGKPSIYYSDSVIDFLIDIDEAPASYLLFHKKLKWYRMFTIENGMLPNAVTIVNENSTFVPIRVQTNIGQVISYVAMDENNMVTVMKNLDEFDVLVCVK
jgi:hypothetical protein